MSPCFQIILGKVIANSPPLGESWHAEGCVSPGKDVADGRCRMVVGGDYKKPLKGSLREF
jgi:hypothetical protein